MQIFMQFLAKLGHFLGESNYYGWVLKLVLVLYAQALSRIETVISIFVMRDIA